MFPYLFTNKLTPQFQLIAFCCKDFERNRRDYGHSNKDGKSSEMGSP